MQSKTTQELLKSEEFSEIVLRHLFRSAMIRATAMILKLTPDDFPSEIAGGFRGHKLFATVALNPTTPVNPPADLLLGLVKATMTQLPTSVSPEEIVRLWQGICDLELNEEYVNGLLPEFVKTIRQQKALIDVHGDMDALQKRLSEIAVQIEQSTANNFGRVFKPFETLVEKSITTQIPFGIPEIDSIVGGLGYGEFGLILGYPGGGKSMVGTHLLRTAVVNGLKSLYFSLEEPGENIANRIYASVFSIEYTKLHKGQAGLELTQAFNDLPEHRKALLSNMVIDDVRDLTPLSVEGLKTRLEKHASEGFLPDLIIVDQLDYMQPIAGSELEGWEKYKLVAFEFQRFVANYKIAGQKTFGAWMLHQVQGKLKKYFTRQEISGFKGIDRPADICLGLGRDDPKDEWINIFSLKSRHSKNFEVKMDTQMRFMRFMGCTSMNNNFNAADVPPPPVICMPTQQELIHG